jgi:hypothetical protein
MELQDFIDFASKELYFLIAFLCGLYIGFVVGKRDGDV